MAFNTLLHYHKQQCTDRPTLRLSPKKMLNLLLYFPTATVFNFSWHFSAFPTLNLAAEEEHVGNSHHTRKQQG